MDSNISNLSIISPDAKIGNGVKISPFVIIEADVVIGNNTEIQPNSHIQNGARIGENCKIFTGASIGAAPQDLKFDGEYKTLASVGSGEGCFVKSSPGIAGCADWSGVFLGRLCQSPCGYHAVGPR